MTDNANAAGATARWQPIAAVDRRVLGVLVEKAKTTPDAYPLSLNALVTGCNQKNNRHPLTQYEAQDVEESLERLRRLGAVAAVQAGGRVEKYRHYMYEWLGVDKVELAVMAELLLRGAQTEGELRGRAARMDPIPDLGALRSVMDALKAKGLVQALTPEGRGQVVSHTLYLPEELVRLREQYAEGAGAADLDSSLVRAARAPEPRSSPHGSPVETQASAARASQSATNAADGGDSAALRREIDELRASVAQLRSDLADLSAQVRRNADELDELHRSLGG
jgi:uncharacterized protein YceH (UPF0502 family)